MNEVIKYNTPIEVMLSKRYKNRHKKAEALFAKYWQNLWD